jgi:hypothetical protein
MNCIAACASFTWARARFRCKNRLPKQRRKPTVNAAQGYVQNLNQAAIQTELANYQTRLKAYIDSTPTGVSSTVGDVIGKKIIPQQTHEMLAGSLPYTVVLAGNQAATIPTSQQHQFTYQLSTVDPYGYEGSSILAFTDKLSNLVGKRLTLSYIPATQLDANLIASYLPKPHADGSPILPSELPTALPGYLINLKAQINLDGIPVATSATALQMGTDLKSTGGFTRLDDLSQWDLTSEESNVVGQATAIGISAGGISAVQLSQLKDRLTATQTKLQAVQANPATATATLAGVTGEQISGDLLTATIWSWFAAAESHNRLSQNQANMIENQGLSYGLFHAIAQPVYSWGVIRAVKFPGVNMDIGHVRPIGWSKDNDRATWIAYNKLRGNHMSGLEHAVPERFFNDSTICNFQDAVTSNPTLQPCPQGISAVKAIGLAAAQGQKIYTITPEVFANNPNIVSANLAAHSYRTKQAILNALNSGMEVNTHEKPITQSGWTGSGYTFTDPQTGAGGYIIDGGSNGAFQTGAQLGIMVVLDLMLYAFTIPTGGSATALPAYIAVILAGEIARAEHQFSSNPDDLACFWGGFFFGLGGLLAAVGILTVGIAGAAAVGFLAWLLPGVFIPTNTALQCKAFPWQR